jgi:hypothetical protein
MSQPLIKRFRRMLHIQKYGKHKVKRPEKAKKGG